MSEHDHINHLRSLLNKGRVLPVVGTGVSYLSTGGDSMSTWGGLINNGIGFVANNVADIPENWSNSISSTNSTDATTLIEMADEIESRLGDAGSDAFFKWLHGSVGTLRAKRPETIKAIGKLGRIVATTNYDSLIEDAIGGPPVTWLNRSKLHQVIRGDDYGVIHLHGYWEEPNSLIFSSKSYKRITEDDFSQTMLRSLVVMHSLLFIGFGSGLSDPNFSRLRTWMRSWVRYSPYGHFRLVRSQEYDEMSKVHPDSERILPIVYGDDYSDLPSFINDLATAPRSKTVVATQNRRWRSLECVTFPLLSRSERAVTGFLSEIGIGLIKQFEAKAPIRFSILFKVETIEREGIEFPVIVTYCHHAEFLNVVKDHYQSKATRAYELKALNLTAEELEDAKRKIAEEDAAEIADWRWKVHFSLVDTFHCLRLEVDHPRKEISIAVENKMSINPEDYENRVRSTSELFGFLASCLNLTFGITSLDGVADNPNLIPLLVDVLDGKGIDLHGIRFDADAHEEWIYVNDEFSEEIGGFLKAID
jgi:SIR2-like domain